MDSRILLSRNQRILLKAMFECIYRVFQVTEEQMGAVIEMFIDRLPEYIQITLAKEPIVA